MENFSLLELYGIKKRLIQENYGDVELMDLVLETIKNKEKSLFEDTLVNKENIIPVFEKKNIQKIIKNKNSNIIKKFNLFK